MLQKHHKPTFLGIQIFQWPLFLEQFDELDTVVAELQRSVGEQIAAHVLGSTVRRERVEAPRVLLHRHLHDFRTGAHASRIRPSAGFSQREG